MTIYYLTVFETDGEKLLDEGFQAHSELEAKEISQQKLLDKNYSDKIYRCTTASGKLILVNY